MICLISWPVLPVSFQEQSGLGVDLFLTQVLNVKLITKLFLVLDVSLNLEQIFYIYTLLLQNDFCPSSSE